MSSKQIATDGSVAVGGDVHAPILNVNIAAEQGAHVNVSLARPATPELPSLLAAVISSFAREKIGEYGVGARRNLPPEVADKVKYNCLPESHSILVDWRRHSHLLEKCYEGVEQENSDARILVRRKARTAYNKVLDDSCIAANIKPQGRAQHAIANALVIMQQVVSSLIEEYSGSSQSGLSCSAETVDLAVSLVVADAFIECEVLEQPPNAITT